MEPIQKRYGSNLPHWTSKGGIYAVTFRLADSLPQAVLSLWRQEASILARKVARDAKTLSPTERKRLAALLNDRSQQYLDSGAGACWLGHSQAAKIVREALGHFQGERYWIFAWCIMPNHVHVVVRPSPEHSLARIVQTWKSYSAREIARQLPVKKPLWQTEYYDHLIRDGADCRRAVRYVLQNPSKAGLANWPWVGEELPHCKA